MIPIFVISLPQAIQKQERMKKLMQGLDLPFEFVWGIDGRLLTEEELQEIFDKEKSYNYFKWYRNRTGAAGIELSRGEIGCALAHRKAHQKIVDEGIERAIILEDDAFVSDFFPHIIEKVVASIDQNSIRRNLIIKLDVKSSTEVGYYKKIKNTLNRFLRPVQIRIDKELAIVKTPINFGGAQGYYIDNAAAHTMLSLNNPVFITSDEWNYYARFVKVRALNKDIASAKGGHGWDGKSDIWNDFPIQASVSFKYRYIGVIKKIIIKIYLLLWR
ncbi:MAG: glycosyltransferase family 25 protein [Fibromonadaceae bacterium]|jgi:glycosyl transferase family 25|nr:glycosyltransferase family 25 protein [Fibromonadaceae bacterium]